MRGFFPVTIPPGNMLTFSVTGASMDFANTIIVSIRGHNESQSHISDGFFFIGP